VIESQDLTNPEPREVPTFTAQDIKAQVQLIQEVMQAVMQEGHHYGVIPGTEKPTLLKPGAEKLTMTFRLAPMLQVQARDLDDVHREYQVRCTLVHIPTGRVYGEGVGLCSTLESRYRYRYAERTCPRCGRATIIKGRAEYGGGWLCYQRKGGCGAKFTAQDPAITHQQVGRMENPDIADTYNTVLKMAKKRALIDATLTATAASDIFTQDLEDSLAVAVESPASEVPGAQTLSSSAVMPPATAAPPERGEPLSTKQLEIVRLAQRRSKVSEADCNSYLLETYGVAELTELQQRHLPRVLEWLALRQARRQVTEGQGLPQESN
jgi:hypothetical protein